MNDNTFQYLYPKLAAGINSASSQNYPIGFAWTNNGVYYERFFQGTGVACRLPDNAGFAVVDQTVNRLNGIGYFLNMKNEIIFKVQKPDQQKKFTVNFYDVYLVTNGIQFIFSSSDGGWYDYRLVLNPKNFEVIEFCPTK